MSLDVSFDMNLDMSLLRKAAKPLPKDSFEKKKRQWSSRGSE